MSGHGLVPASVSTLASSVSGAVMLATVRQTVLAAASAFLLIGLGVGLFARMIKEQSSPPPVASQTRSSEPPPSRPQAVVALQPTSTGPMVEIRGRVIDRTGQPVPGARIVLDPKFQSISGEEFGTPSERAVSGSDGRFSFSIARARSRLCEMPGMERAHPCTRPWLPVEARRG